jgi:hypothetical protein
MGDDPTNGYVRWRDLEDTRRREVDAAKALHDVQDARLDAIESVLDQQRGARSLVYGLIGSNILLVVVSVFTIMHFIGFI